VLIGRRARSSLSATAHRKEVDFDKGKVLLSRIGDKVYATSAFCTHYGAPLAKAVLTADGRIVWYRICHNQRIAFISPYVCRTTQPMARRLVISIRQCDMIVAETSSSKACFNVCTGDIGIFPTPSPPDSPLVLSVVQRMPQHPVRCTASKLVLRTERSLSLPILLIH
jgi:hypothetical protein